MTLRPTMMTLGELLRGLPTTRVVGSTATPIADIAYHSKAVRSGGLFVAIPGLQHDGHAFVSEAIARGAAAVVVQRPTEVPPGVTQVVVADSRIALASLSCAFFGEPSRAFSLIGITGTNGKGTTAYLLDAVLARAGRRTGVVGTLGVKVGARTTPLDRTTPEAPDLQRILRQMADQHLDCVMMEVASHALALHLGGSEFMAVTPRGRLPVRLRLHGRFNVYNALAAIAAADAQQIALDVIGQALEGFAGVPGRFEAVDEGQSFAVIVDYAHTPDGLENVLQAARSFASGRTLVVFGCGGDRDRTKRPVMGRIAAQLADVAIVTSDNPRSEEPTAIIEEILTGIRDPGSGIRNQPSKAQIEVEPDRRKAISRAIELARPGDVVLIAGKGHEPYHEIHGVKHPFDDRVVAREALRNLQAPREERR